MNHLFLKFLNISREGEIFVKGGTLVNKVEKFKKIQNSVFSMKRSYRVMSNTIKKKVIIKFSFRLKTALLHFYGKVILL